MELNEQRQKLTFALGDINKSTGALSYLIDVYVENPTVKQRMKLRIKEVEKSASLVRDVYESLSKGE